MIRFYILPVQVTYGPTGNPQYGPKYLRHMNNPGGIDIRPWSMKMYGMIEACMVAGDVTQAQHEQLVAEPDVTAAPEDIDNNISELAIPAVQAVLEELRIPAGWVTTEFTYRQLLRMVAGLFLFAQRHKGMHAEELIESKEALDLRWNQIPVERQDRIKATADDMGYSYADVTNTWLVRRILRYLADQWGETPILFGFTEL